MIGDGSRDSRWIRVAENVEPDHQTVNGNVARVVRSKNGRASRRDVLVSPTLTAKIFVIERADDQLAEGHEARVHTEGVIAVASIPEVYVLGALPRLSAQKERGQGIGKSW